MTTTADSFTFLTPWVGTGQAAPSTWLPLTRCPLLILVGLTGVGKSTAVAGLTASGSALRLLPDRRILTDQLLIPRVQQAVGETARPISDRAERFAYTRRYREYWPGGMAHALSQLWLDPDVATASQLLFDGLRGENEVRHAAQLLPQARFVMLDAPHAVRVRRLLGREDAFDQINPVESQVGALAANLADLGLAEADELFSPAQARSLLALVQSGAVSPIDLQAKVQIVLAERRNYDPDATQAALRQHAPQRSLIIDTTRYGPAEVVGQILAGLE